MKYEYKLNCWYIHKLTGELLKLGKIYGSVGKFTRKNPKIIKIQNVNIKITTAVCRLENVKFDNDQLTLF